MELEFPIEFLVSGTPVSFQASRPEARNEWKQRVRDASRLVLPEWWLSSEGRIAVTLLYFPDTPMQGDIDNIVKLILDALNAHIYMDDVQVERLVVQKFEPDNLFEFASPTPRLQEALNVEKPVLYVRISNNPFEDLH